MQLGPTQHERNPLEDTKRLVEQLRKNGTVDNLHTQALNALFQSEAFKAEVQQWMQQREKPLTSSKDDHDALSDVALSALPCLLAGTMDWQTPPATGSNPQQQSPARQQSQPQQQPAQPQQQQQHPPRPGQATSGGVSLPTQQQPAPAARYARGLPRQQQAQQQQQQVCIAQETTNKLRLALINMLESEEKMLQARFKQYYAACTEQLMCQKPTPPPAYTTELPEGTLSPASPVHLYLDSEPEAQPAAADRQQQSQSGQQSAGGIAGSQAQGSATVGSSSQRTH